MGEFGSGLHIQSDVGRSDDEKSNFLRIVLESSPEIFAEKFSKQTT